MKRRKFIALLGGAAAAWPVAVSAQQPDAVRRIAVLSASSENDPEAQARLAVFGQGLEKLGWRDGHNVRIDYRWGNGDAKLIRAHAIELVRLKPDAILAISSLTLQPLQRETGSIPIVFTQIADPVGSGFVASLAHPGGNITGFTPAEFSMFGKLLEVLKEIAPFVARVAVILNSEQRPQMGMWRAIEAAAPSFKVKLTAANVRNAAEIERAIDEFAREPNGGVIVLPNPITELNRGLIITMTARRRLPAVYAYRHYIAEGGLISYGINSAVQHGQAASYVDRILRGAKPADLPVQQPAKFELTINLKAAKALGLEVPLFLQQRADEIIE